MERSIDDFKDRWTMPVVSDWQPPQHNDEPEKNETVDEKKKELYLNQKQLLETFLERGAISKAQFDKSLGDLTEKMGM